MKLKVLSEPQGKYQLYCFLLMVGLFVCMELLGPLFVHIEKGANVFNSLNVVLCAAFNASAILLLLSFLHRFVFLGKIIVTVIYGCYCYANLLHYRGIGSYLPVQMLTQTQQLEGLGDSIFGLIRWYDVFFILLPAGLIYSYGRVKRKLTDFRMSRHLAIAGIFLILTAPLSYIGYKAIGAGFKRFSGQIIERGHLSPLDTYMRVGLAPIIYYQLHVMNTSDFGGINEEELGQIREVISDNLSVNNAYVSPSPRKNVVIMLMESFNTSCVSPDIMPALDSLCSLPTTLSCPNVVQIPQGAMSIGGQLIVLSGLNGLMAAPFCALCPYNVYPSISRELKARNEDAYSYIVISTDIYYWRQNEVSEALGFDDVYGINDGMTLFNKNKWADDKDVFRKALSSIPSDDRPFCCVIAPSNMHADYTVDKTIDCPVVFEDVKDEKCHEYFRRARYLDEQISSFIAGLQARGVYDETLIVVTSDHQIPYNYCSEEMKSDISPYFPAMYINTGCDWAENNKMNEEVVYCHNQIYPTTLQLMGLRPDEYAGFFPSMTNCVGFSCTDPSDERLKRFYHFQEKIIRGSYFGTK